MKQLNGTVYDVDTLNKKNLKNCWQSSSVMIQYNQSKGKGSEQNEEKAE